MPWSSSNIDSKYTLTENQQANCEAVRAGTLTHPSAQGWNGKHSLAENSVGNDIRRLLYRATDKTLTLKQIIERMPMAFNKEPTLGALMDAADYMRELGKQGITTLSNS